MSNILYAEHHVSALDEAYLESLSKANAVRVTQQKKQWEYYKGDIIQLKGYLQASLKETWRESTVDRMQLTYINIVKKIVKALSAVYVQAPQRYVKVNGKISESATKYFNSILDPALNKYDKETQRMAKLHNTAVPFLSFKDGKFKQHVDSSWLYNVYASYDDNDVIEKITYAKYFENTDGRPELYTVVWTDKEHYMIDANSNEMKLPGRTDRVNPYGVIPVPFLRVESGDDFWGEGQDLLVRANEIVNILKTKLVYDDVIMGTAGMLLGVNLGELSSNNVLGESQIAGGRDSILTVDQKPGETNTVDLRYVSTNPQIEQVMKEIDWEIKSMAMSVGLNPSNFSVVEQAVSGFSRLIESVEQAEVRIDDIDACREYEIRRFEIIKKMNNSLVAGDFENTQMLKAIPEGAELEIDFVEVDKQETSTERWSDRREKEKRNLATPLTWLREDNPDVKSDSEASSIIEMNKEINDKLGVDKIDGNEGDGRNKIEPTASGEDIGKGMSDITE